MVQFILTYSFTAAVSAKYSIPAGKIETSRMHAYTEQDVRNHAERSGWVVISIERA